MSNELTLSDFSEHIQKGFIDSDINKGWITTKDGNKAFLGNDGELKFTKREIENGLANSNEVDVSSISKILADYSSREMGFLKVMDFVNENKKSAKKFLDSKGILSKDHFKKYVKGLHNAARKGKGKERQEDEKKWQKIKDDFHLENIMQLAHEQESKMQERIKNTNV